MLKFFKDILLYSGGSFIGRIVTLFLLPLTTSYLTPWDYGVIGILTLVPTFANGLFSAGFHTSLGRVYSSGKTKVEKEGIIWTAFCTLVFNNFVLTSLALFFAKPISSILLGNASLSHLIVLTFLGIGICTVRMAFEYYLRASQQAKKVFFLNLADVTVSISSMIFMVVYLQRGVAGYMEAIILTHSFNLILMMLVVCPTLSFSIQWNYGKELIKIGLPCIYGYWGYCMLQGISRYILQLFSTESEVGLYFLGSNIGRVIELPLWGFMSAWVPLFNSYLNKQEEAPQVFSKVMTYYLFGLSGCVAALFCLAKPVVHAFVQPPFYDIWTVVGLTAAAQGLWGVYAITYPPLIFHKKTGVQSCLELGAGVCCIGLNIPLILIGGKMGAAFATFLGFLGLVTASLWINQRLIWIPYEKKRIGKIGIALTITGCLSFIPFSNAILYNGSMILVLAAFYSYCWYGILSKSERDSLLDLLKSWLKLRSNPSTEVPSERPL